MMKPFRARVLLVDDDLSNLLVLQKILEQEAYSVITARSAADALQFFRKQGADIILSDLRMPGMSGLELLKAVRLISQNVPVLILTAFGTVDDAVEAMKLGAVDFIAKPIKRASVLRVMQDALAKNESSQSGTLKMRESKDHSQQLFLGLSPVMQEIRRSIKMLAPTGASIFIEGESGTGKEVVAKLIHQESGRSGQMVSINCGAIPEGLLESELFGYERGAFTGASTSKKGLFEVADKGTLFLDEIGEMPASLQVKLLRVLEDGCFHQLGSTQTKKVDVRVIAATNAKVQEKILAGTFREDLFFRLNVVHLELPPLRERGNDIKVLAEQFLENSSQQYKKQDIKFSPDAISAILQYGWPGNIRELKNNIERAVVLDSTGLITVTDLKLPLKGGERISERPSELVFTVGTSLREVEKIMIQKTLESTKGDKNLAAKLLGINLRTIYRKIQETDFDS